jgi:hypothetical protein
MMTVAKARSNGAVAVSFVVNVKGIGLAKVFTLSKPKREPGRQRLICSRDYLGKSANGCYEE